MADRRKRSPAVRFLKRNGLYIIIVCVLLLVAAAAVTVVTQVRRLSPAKQEEPAQSVSQTEEPSQESPAGPAQEKAPEEEAPVDESVYVPPFDGKTILTADGKLVMTFDEQALAMQETDGLVSLTDAAGALTARLDIQKLGADMALFKQSELERICIGVVQAYYYLAPETKDFTVTDAVKEDGHFEAAVTAPAYDTQAAVAARVALWKLDGVSWCVSAIVPDGEDGADVFAAFSSIEPLGDRHLAEAQP